MIYLLDVNALLALGFTEHVHHERVERWLQFVRATRWGSVTLASCSITEIGFVRISSGGAALASSVSDARTALLRLKRTEAIRFIPAGVGGENLPPWVSRSAQVTDGHLLQLATRCGARLATLDEGIPGAELISDEPHGPLEVRDSVERLPYGTQRPSEQAHERSSTLFLH